MSTAEPQTFRSLYPDRKQWRDPQWFDRYADLSCAADDGSLCFDLGGKATRNSDNFVCTRPGGHDGPHIADTGTQVVSVWETPGDGI